jgi:RimJ/RimL family protein N-acetyltransferase
MLPTPRLRLRPWAEADRAAFRAMHADAEVMHDLGGAFDRARADAKFDRYTIAFTSNGHTRWAVTDLGDMFLGYAGMMVQGVDHPLGAHADIGWRFIRAAWGNGYASEAAQAALHDGFSRCGLREVFAYTAPDNARSQAVMTRLKLTRDPARDFTLVETGWRGLVWVARP